LKGGATMGLWRVSDGKFTTRYIRANSLDEAKTIFDDQNPWSKAVKFQPTDDKIFAVYFTDNPFDPAYFKGTKTEALKGARLYIRQWGLDAKIDRIEAV
jgi:hypothetical protein